jgi:MFS family permease
MHDTIPSSPAVQTSGTHATAARNAVAVIFFMHGILTGSWVPHIPIAKAELGVGTGVFGWILLAMAGGGILAMPIAGYVINRFGSAPVAKLTGLVFCCAFCLPILAATPLTLAMGLIVFGAALGALDVAMNAHGLAVEIRLRRAVMSSFHGWFSVGSAVGAGLGGIIIGAGGEATHVVFVIILTLAMLAYAWVRFLPGSADQGTSGTSFGLPTRATLGLGALCFLALLIEGAMLDWSALHLVQHVNASVYVAGFGYAAFSTGMAVARFTGDILRMRFGAVAVVFYSALALTGGLIAALTLLSPIPAIIAFALAGVGVGNIAPVLFAGGGRADPDAPGRGIAAVTTMGYSGFLLGPPLIGMVAEFTGLQGALLLTVVAALIIVVFARAARAADG